MTGRTLNPVVPLAKSHRTSDFDCGVESLNVFIKRFALRNQEKTHSARTFVLTRGLAVVGYFSLSAGSVQKAELPPELGTGQPDAVPIILLGRMAVDIREKGQGLGSGLLQQAVRKVAVASQSIGVAAMLVHAIDDNALRFYEYHGFRGFPLHPRTLYLSIQEILEAFDDEAVTLDV